MPGVLCSTKTPRNHGARSRGHTRQWPPGALAQRDINSHMSTRKRLACKRAAEARSPGRIRAERVWGASADMPRRGVRNALCAARARALDISVRACHRRFHENMVSS